ncbi:MAG: NfeD family protein [Bacteroidales bacterium]|nr:NfeD family protein [Bacteroidales bacterium]
MILDFLVIPGGVVAIFGVLCMIGGVVASFVQYGATAGVICLFVTAAVTIASFVLMMRTKTWRRLQLKTEIDGKMNDVDPEKVQVGMTGVAISRLAPMGTGQFGSEIVEVSSIQDFIEVDTEIEIVKIEGGKITVKPKQ